MGYSNKRPFWITQSTYLGTGIVFIKHELENDNKPIHGEE